MKYDQRKEIETAFGLFDTQKRNLLDIRELRGMAKALGFDFKKEELRKIVISVGKYPSDLLAVHEVLKIFENRLPVRRTREEATTLFKLLDMSGKGRVSPSDLLKLSEELGEPLSKDEAMKLIESADADGDGFLNFEEFYRVVKRRGEYPHDWLDFDASPANASSRDRSIEADAYYDSDLEY